MRETELSVAERDVTETLKSVTMLTDSEHNLGAILRRWLNIARLCVHVPALQNLQPRSELTLYCKGGYQLGLLSPALSLVVCARSHQRGRLASYDSTSAQNVAAADFNQRYSKPSLFQPRGAACFNRESMSD